MNPVHVEVYSIQHYIIKLHATGLWFSPGNPVSSTNKTDHQEITVEIGIKHHKPAQTKLYLRLTRL